MKHNCMDYKPALGGLNQQFTCPECGQVYVLAGVGPGNYWETKEEHTQDLNKAKQLLDELKSLPSAINNITYYLIIISGNKQQLCGPYRDKQERQRKALEIYHSPFFRKDYDQLVWFDINIKIEHQCGHYTKDELAQTLTGL